MHEPGPGGGGVVGGGVVGGGVVGGGVVGGGVVGGGVVPPQTPLSIQTSHWAEWVDGDSFWVHHFAV